MKKFLKFIVILVIIFIAFFIINFCRNYFILKNIYNLGMEFETNNNYSIQEKINTTNVNQVINYYYMDGRYLYIEEQDKNYNRVIFHNIDTKEYIELTANENGELTPADNQIQKDESNFIDNFIYYKNSNFSDLLKKNIFKIIKEDNENYIINLSNQYEYVDKANGLLKKIISVKNNIILEVNFEKDVVDTKTIDINQYSV